MSPQLDPSFIMELLAYIQYIEQPLPVVESQISKYTPVKRRTDNSRMRQVSVMGNPWVVAQLLISAVQAQAPSPEPGQARPLQAKLRPEPGPHTFDSRAWPGV